MRSIYLFFIFMPISFTGAASIWSNDYAGPIWHKEYDVTIAKAEAQSRPILIYFSGSDWCGPCRKLDRKVLTKQRFQEYVQDNYVLLNLDFPSNDEETLQHIEQKNRLKERFDIRAYPMMLVIDSKGGTLIEPFVGCGLLGCSEKRIVKKLKKAAALASAL